MSQNELLKVGVEEWRPVVGFEGVYLISSEARLMRIGKTKTRPANYILIPSLDKRTGRYKLTLTMNSRCTKRWRSHVVAEAFLGPRPKGTPESGRFEVNHMDRVKTNDRASNLEYVTCKENIRHSFRVGVRNTARGETHPKAKLKASSVVEIRRRRLGGESFSSLAREFGITPQSCMVICTGKTWKHIPME